MYTFNTRLRYSELDSNLKLPLVSLVNLFQDCSTFHSESIGKGIEYLYSHNKVWIICAWQIEIYDQPGLLEDISVNTWPYKFDSLFGYRNFTLTNSYGKVYAAANSIWNLLNTVSLHPEKITSEDSDGYILEEPYDMAYMPRKIKYNNINFEKTNPIPVVDAHLDSNKHVNNGQYLSIADGILPKEFTYNRVRGEYKKSALPGDIFYPQIQIDNNIATVLLCDNNDKIYTTIQFDTINR